MVYVFKACCSDFRHSDKINDVWQSIPLPILERNRSLKFREDALRHLLGNILLMNALNELGFYELSLKELQFNKFGKPYFPADISFNISHSGNYVLCAISKAYNVGIDVEEIKSIEMDAFLNCFTYNEWSYIKMAHDPLMAFYRFWTRKEAIIKADGRGLNIPLTHFEVITNDVVIGSRTWYLVELNVAPGYVAHMATNTDIKDDYLVQQIM